jgi:hypothetical protein
MEESMLQTVLHPAETLRFSQTEQPIMIHGQIPRCGTNFLMDVLAKHTDVAREPADILEFHHFMMVEGLHRYMARLKQTNHMKSLDEPKLRKCFGDAWLNYMRGFVEDPQQCMVLKESNVDYLDYFFEYFPQARLILVVRDGRNAVPSALRSNFVAPPNLGNRLKNPQSWTQRFGTYDLETLSKKIRQRVGKSDLEIICHQWNTAAIKIHHLVNQVFQDRKEQVLLVRYEDLFQNMTEEVQKVLDFCNLSIDKFDWEALGVMPVRGSSFLRDKKGNIDFKKGINPDGSFDPMNRWDKLSPKQKATFWKHCRTGMEALGYSNQNK